MKKIVSMSSVQECAICSDVLLLVMKWYITYKRQFWKSREIIGLPLLSGGSNIFHKIVHTECQVMMGGKELLFYSITFKKAHT